MAAIQLVFAFAALLVLSSFSFSSLTASGQQTTGREIVFPVAIQWNREKGVTRYRLQIAADYKFQDIFYDGRVIGNRFVPSNLSPGLYYWRVAPAESRLGEFSCPVQFFVSGGVATNVRLPKRRARSR